MSHQKKAKGCAQVAAGVGGGAPRGEEFEFTLAGKRTRWSDEVLIEQLRAFAKSRGKTTFSQEEFRAWPDRVCIPVTIARRLGGWRRAMAAAGLRASGNARFDAEELIERLERAWRFVGRRPGLRALREHGDVSEAPYRARWGSLRRVCALFVQYKRGLISRRVLLRTRKGERKAISAGKRWEVLQRDRHTCRGCGRGSRMKGVKLEVDHIVPVCRGGRNDLKNLQTLCWDCNRGKGGRR